MQKSKLILRVLLVAFWIRMTIGYVAQMVIPALADVLPHVYLLFDAVVVTLGCWTMKRRRDMAVVAVVIAVTALSTLLVNRYSLLFYLNGMRDFISFMFVIPILNFFLSDDKLRDQFVATVERHLFMYLVVQAPCTITQFIRFGATDPVGGSLGENYSGITSTLIYLVSFYLLQRRLDRDRLWVSLLENKWLIILLFPTFLNETKVSLVYLAMYMLLMIPLGRKTFRYTVLAVPVFALVFYGGMTAYVVATGGTQGDVFSLDYYMEGYLLSEDAESTERLAKWMLENDSDGEAGGLTGDVPRLTKLVVLGELVDEPSTLIAGNGVGHFKGGTLVDNSEFYRDNEWVMTGTIPYVFHLLVQLGVLGVLLEIFFFVVYLWFPPAPGMRRNYNLQLYLFALVLLLQLYNDSLRNAFFTLIVFFVMLMSWQKSEPGAVEGVELS